MYKDCFFYADGRDSRRRRRQAINIGVYSTTRTESGHEVLMHMKPTSILDLMVKDHGKIITLLNDVEKSIGGDVISLMKAFDSFEWALEKHIFTEEQAIYTSYNPMNIIEGYKMVPELIQEHNELLNRLRLMRFDVLKKHRCDFEGFKCSLLDHKTFEEEQLYPRLDTELNDEQKLVIVSRIKEIV